MRLLVTRHLSTTHTDSAVGSDPTNTMRWSVRVYFERQQVRHYVLAVAVTWTVLVLHVHSGSMK